jgi:hypothetical protein
MTEPKTIELEIVNSTDVKIEELAVWVESQIARL